MKDNNKRVFLIIVAVATLVMGIMGATFAFFSASGGSANNAVTANATTLANLGFTSSHSKIATNLVPVASENQYFYRYPGIASSGEHSCLDDVGNQICSIYEFTITNTASVAQTIYVSFVPSENTFDNMYFAAFNTTIASANYEVATGSNGSGNNFSLTPQTTSGNSTLGHQATKLTKNNTNPIDMPGLSTNLGAGESITYTVLVWLQETKNEQNTEQGGSFKAGINVTTGGNSTGVTGVMGESSNYFYTNMGTSIGHTVENGTTTYESAASAMTNSNHLVTLKQTLGNFSGYCAYEKENGIETGEYYCIYGQQSTCESVIQYLDNDYTYECKLTTTNNAIAESYVVFTITEEMSATNSGIVPGTYELKGYDPSAYSTNVNIIKTAVGYSTHPERCEGDDSYIICEISGVFRSIRAENDGNVGVTDNSVWGCGVSTGNEVSVDCGDRH